MKLISYLFRRRRSDILLVAALGLAGGAASAGLIPVVNGALHNLNRPSLFLEGFVLIAAMKIACGVLSNILLVRLAQNSVLQLCEELCGRILRAPFREIEKIGSARLFAFLTDDVTIVSNAIQAIPPLTVNLAILAGSAIYLIWLSWAASLVLIGFVLAGALCYKILLTRAHEAIRLARSGRDTLFGHFRALTDGIKELKLSRDRQKLLVDTEIGPAMEFLRKQNLIATRQYVLADGSSQVMFYFIMAALLFALPRFVHVTSEALSAYILAGFYVAAPIWSVAATFPAFDRGREALNRLEGIGLSVSEPQSDTDLIKHGAHPTIEFRDVEFTYGSANEAAGFKLGPLALTLRPGELVFVIGGNGSGKSTFVKLLTGLYTRDSGEIRLDGHLVTAADQEDYRQLFSVVYSDFYLFQRLAGGADTDLESRAQRYLRQLELSEKVSLRGDCLSTVDLSQGQRRRLALLSAYLQDRPVFVLDEWAADQDPAYRQIFYTQLLPELKRTGKTVVVITHDDRYFHLGDRILKLDYGSLIDTGVSHGEAMYDAEPELIR